MGFPRQRMGGPTTRPLLLYPLSSSGSSMGLRPLRPSGDLFRLRLAVQQKQKNSRRFRLVLNVPFQTNTCFRPMQTRFLGQELRHIN